MNPLGSVHVERKYHSSRKTKLLLPELTSKNWPPGKDVYGTVQEKQFIDENFPCLPLMFRIDFGIMEKADNAYVSLGRFSSAGLIYPIMASTVTSSITIFLLIKNAALLPSVFQRIFEEAFGIHQVVAGGFGAVLMQGVKARPVLQRGGLRLRPAPPPPPM